MSNRLMGLLLLLIIIIAGIAFYMYAFVTYTGSVTINTNVTEYSVELYNKKTFKSIEQSCSEEKCELKDIPPFEYNLMVTKDGYKDYEEEISVKRKDIKSVVFALEKDTKLKAIEPLLIEEEVAQTGAIEKTGLNTKEIILSKEEKLERLKNRKLYYSYFEISNFGEIFFKNENSKINIYFRDQLGKENRINSFNNIVKESDIYVQKVLGDYSQVLIEYGEERFLFNSSLASFDTISLEIPIKYIKTGINKSLQFVTDKGTFLYQNKGFEYFSVFEDFVYNEGKYIGLVSGDDERRKKNLNFEDESGTLIVLLDPDTKEKRILLKPDFSVDQILLDSSEGVILIDSEGNKYSLENY